MIDHLLTLKYAYGTALIMTNLKQPGDVCQSAKVSGKTSGIKTSPLLNSEAGSCDS